MMPYWFRLALRSVVNHPRFSFLFAINLAIGLCGFVALDSFSDSFRQSMSSRSRDIVGADLVISSNLPLSQDESASVLRALPAASQISKQISFYSMVASETESRLVRIVAIDDLYPFYGRIVFDSGAAYQAGRDPDLAAAQRTWLDPELIVQLNAKVGEMLRVGSLDFQVSRVIREDTTGSALGFNLAPRIYIHQKYAEDTGLIQRGSRIRYSWLIQIDSAEALQTSVQTLRETFKDNRQISIETHIESSDQMGRLVQYLNDYLSLAAVVALLLAGLGSAYLYREFLSRRLKDLAILLSLGANFNGARAMFVVQLLLLGLVAALVSIAVAYLLIQGLPAALGGILPPDIAVSLQTRSVLWALGVGIACSLLFCFPALSRLRSFRPGVLFQEHLDANIYFSPRTLLTLLPICIFFYGMSVIVTKSWFVATIFFGALLATGIVLSGLSWVVLRGLARSPLITGLSTKLAVRNLYRSPLSTTASVMALGIGVTLVTLIPQIASTLRTELQEGDDSKRPDLFLFDIQDDQFEELQSSLERRGLALDYLSPMVRARLMKIDGKEVKEERNGEDSFRTREDERRDRFQSRSYNLSAREKLASSERLLRGRDFSGTYDWNGGEPVEISLERRFAMRMGMDLGSELTFDIQGVEVIGKVINLRSVKWTSFHPNFFVVMQPGVLDDAPKTFLAAIGGLDFAAKTRLQTEMVREFPNMSLIDVTKTIERIGALSSQMSLALQFMAQLSLVAGMFVLFSICQQQAVARKWEITLVKVLGMAPRKVLGSFLIEISLIVGIAIFVGSLMAVVMATIISYFVFDNWLMPDWQILVSMNFAIAVVGVLLAWIGAARILAIKPAALLNDQ